MSPVSSTRRRLLAGAGVATVGAAVAATPAGATPSGHSPFGRVRILHFTDAHVTPDRARSVPESRRALELGLRYRPDLVLQGGDAIFDALGAGRDAVAAQWAAHHRVHAGLRTPVAHVIGNHDCWTGPGSAGDPLQGKAWAVKELGLERTYYARPLGRWKLIVLDSITLTGAGGSYVGRLGDEQTAWLAGELDATPARTPVVLATHIPIQSALPFTDASLRKGDDFAVPGGWGVHSDTPEINELLLRHPNVRLALSGHNHVRDDITYNTVRFANGGAISGNWWDDADPGYRDTPPGFAIVDLFPDGEVEIQYLSYREVGALEPSADGPARGA